MVKQIPLSQGKHTLVDDEDYDYLSQFSWYCNYDYAVRQDYTENQRTIRMHRVIMDCPKHLVIDHINGNKLDNRKENLRICTRAQNNLNARKRAKSTSTYKGVSLFKGRKPPKTHRWKSQIQFNKQKIAIGYFDTEEEAAVAYDAKAKELFGEFAILNFKER